MNEFYRREYLQRMADHGDRHFEPEAGLLRLPMGGYRNVHSEHLDETPRHPVRESLAYALVLLELAERSLQGRAEAIIARVIGLQDSGDPRAKTYGLWPYFQEEPVAKWPWPDFNWADFNAMTLLFVWHRHRRRLGAALVEKITEAIRRASVCIRRRNVDLNYTNIAIKGTFVTLSAAEVTGDAELLGYAMDRLGRLRETVMAAGGFVEYNSPTYAAVSLAGLHAMDSYVRDERAHAPVAQLLERFWDDVADRFHPETCELAGPHARAYTPSLASAPELLGSLIEKASKGAVRYPQVPGRDPYGCLYACVMNVEAPTSAVGRLAAPATRTRQVTLRSQARATEAPRVQTTWLEPAFCLGSVSFQDGWEQRHNLIAYWKSRKGGVGVLQHRYLRDDRPCCSGYFVSEQQGGAVAAGSFLASYADHHVSVPTDGATTSFLGAVLEVDASGEILVVKVDASGGTASLKVGASRPLKIGDGVRVALGAVSLEWRLTRHEVSPFPAPSCRVERPAADRLRIVLPHYEGERRWVRWLDFERAVSAYTLRMAAAGEALPPADGLSAPLPNSVPPSQLAAEAWGLSCVELPAPKQARAKASTLAATGS